MSATFYFFQKKFKKGVDIIRNAWHTYKHKEQENLNT